MFGHHSTFVIKVVASWFFHHVFIKKHYVKQFVLLLIINELARGSYSFSN